MSETNKLEPEMREPLDLLDSAISYADNAADLAWRYAESADSDAESIARLNDSTEYYRAADILRQARARVETFCERRDWLSGHLFADGVCALCGEPEPVDVLAMLLGSIAAGATSATLESVEASGAHYVRVTEPEALRGLYRVTVKRTVSRWPEWAPRF